MRILAIRGANLASLAREFEVDLTRGPLGDSGLFAIVGNTGAGKSTLLDALCVALFDRTPRAGERQRQTVLIGRGAQEASKVGAHDVRALLRRGAGRGFAEVDFQGDDGRRYRAHWEVHRARDKADGALQSQEMSLLALEEGERLGGTKTETLAAIEERLGLSFDQFRRSALLAQGDFAAFLRADGRDRSELLERMTGTEIYTQLSIAAHRRGQLAEQRVQELRKSLTVIEVLSEDDERALRAELEQASQEHARAKRELEAAERAAQWREVRARLTGEVAEAELELERRADAGELAAALQRERELRVRTEPLRAAWSTAQVATRAAAERRQQAELAEAAAQRAAEAAAEARQHGERVATLLAPLRELRDAIASPPAPSWPAAKDAPPAVEVLALRVAEPLAWLTSRRHLHGLAEAWPEIVATRERDEALRQAVVALERQLQRLATEAERLASRRAVLDEDRQRARGALEEATRRAAIASLPEGKHASSLETASRAEDAARSALAQAEQLHTIGEQATAAAEAAAEATARHAAALAAIAAAERELAALDEALRVDAAALREAEGALGRLTTAADLAHARAHLVAGDPCPLCGALEHPWAGRGAFDELVVEQEAAVAAVRARLAAARERRLRLDLELPTFRDDAAAHEAAQRQAQARGLAAAQAWRAALMELGELILVAEPTGAAASALAKEHLTRARRALERARAERSKLQALANAAAEASALLLTKRHDLEQLDYRLAELERERRELDARVTRGHRERAGHLAARAELAAALASRLSAWGVGRDELEQEAARVLDELGRAVDDWRHHQARLTELESALGWHLERGLASAAAADTQLVSARASFETYARQAATAQAELEAHTAALLEACEAQALTVEQLSEAMAAPPGRLHELSELLAETARRLDQARSVLDERRRALAEHDKSPQAPARVEDAPDAPDAPDAQAPPREPPGVAPWEAHLAELRQRAAALEERVLSLRARLERDEADRRRREAMSARVSAVEQAGEVDRALAQAIGSHDGKLLRAFAQSLTLDTLLELANLHLDELAPRYQLERVPRYDLELQVIDRDMGEEVRSVQSLSGGESFLVSLALALALSSLAAGSVRVRTLLIDEGFGSLDPATLDGALAVLDALQATGRQVGIISHIPGLVERVGAHVKIVQRGGGRSDVVTAS